MYWILTVSFGSIQIASLLRSSSLAKGFSFLAIGSTSWVNWRHSSRVNLPVPRDQCR